MKQLSIRNAMKKQWILLAVLCAWEGLFFLIANTSLRNSMAEFGIRNQNVPIIMLAINLFLGAVSATIDLMMLRKILRLKPLLSVRPVVCRVEDFIVTGYTSEGERKYNVFLLLKDPVANQLLLTYGKYSLSFYNSSVIKAGHNLMDIRIFRKDGSTVQVGDRVDVYVKKFVNVIATIEDNTLFLNKKPFRFQHSNPNGSIRSLAQAKFYEGAVVVDP